MFTPREKIKKAVVSGLFVFSILGAVQAVETPDFWAERNKDGNRRNAGAKSIDGNLRVRWARNFNDMRTLVDGQSGNYLFAERSDNFSVRDGRIILIVPPSYATAGVKTNDTYAIYGTFSITDGRLLNTIQSPHVCPMPLYSPGFDLTDTSPGKIFQSWGSDGVFFTANGGDTGRTCQFDPYTGEIPAGQPIHWSPHTIDEDGAFAMSDANPRFFLNGAKGKAGGYHEYPHFGTRAEVGDQLIKGARYYAPFLLENKTGYTFDFDSNYRTRLTRWDVTENPFTVVNAGGFRGEGNGTWTYVDPSIVFTDGSLNSAAGYRPICLGEDGRVYYFGFKGLSSYSNADFSQGMFLVGVRCADGVADKTIHVDYDILQEAQGLLPGYSGSGLRRMILPQLASRGNTVLVFQPQEEILPSCFGGVMARSTFTKGHLFCFDTAANTLRWRYDFPAGYFQTNVRPKDNNVKDCQEDVQVVISGNEAFVVHPLVQGGVLKVQVERFSLADGTTSTTTMTPLANGQPIPVTGIDAKIGEIAAVDGTIICMIDHSYNLFNATPLRANPTRQALVVLEGDASASKDYPPVAVMSAPITGTSYFEGILSDYLFRPSDEFYAGTSIDFSSVGSVDVDGDSIVAYDWSFGDGTTSTLPNPSHTFAATGAAMQATDRTVTLRVQDSRGNWSKQVTRVLSILNAGSIQTTVRNAVADSYVDFTATNVSKNFGTSTVMKVGAASTKSGVTRSYIKFDTSGVDLANLVSAKLRINTSRLANGSNCALQVFQSADNWTETGITSVNAPAPGSEIVEQSLVSGNGVMVNAFPNDAYTVWIEMPVTEYIRTAGTDGFVSFALSMPASTVNLATKEGGYVPQLVLETGTFLLAAPIFTQQPPATINLADVYTANLSTLASSSLGEAALTYHWQVQSTPVGGTLTFSANHSNAAKATTITLTQYITGTYTLRCVVSDGFQIKESNLVTVNVSVGNAPPTVATAASANPTTTTGTTSTLAVLGADDGGESSLTYTWSVTTNLKGTPLPTFSVNGTNAAKNTTVTFTAGDSYTFTVKIADTAGNFVNSSVVVNVTSLSQWVMTPSTVTLAPGQTQNFVFGSRDQFGQGFDLNCDWTVSGGGTITTPGVIGTFTAGSTPGTFTVTGAYVGGAYFNGTATVTITGGGSNTAPTISNIADQATNEDVATGTIAFTVGDAETAAGLLSLTKTSSNPTLVPTANIVFGGTGASRNVVITPAANQTGTSTITVTVSDGALTTTDTFVLTVNAVNDAPVANAQSVTTSEDTAKPITLAGSDVESFSLTCTVLAQPAHGLLTGTAPALTYTPDANYNGPDSFTFKVNDGTVDSLPATVSISITAVNDAPTIANIGNQTTSQDTPTSAIAFAVSDVETAAGLLTPTGASSNTTLVPVSNIVFGGSGANRTVTLTPAAGQTGTSTITITVSDGSLTASATFVLTVNGVNRAPVANAQSVTTNEDTAKPITLSGSDSDGNSLTYIVVGNPAHGTLSGSAQNLTYTPAANYNGPDSFTFKVNDGTVDSSPATVSITVSSVNDLPVANAQSVTTNEDTVKLITLAGSDVESFSLTYTVVTQPAHGLLTGTAPALTYTPDANYNGPDSFTFKVNDGTVDSAVATVSITVSFVNDVPVANAQSVTTNEDTAKPITLSGSDVDGNSLTYVVVANPANGTLSGSGQNLTYTPASNYNGPDSFTFKVNDGTVDSPTATVSITVTAGNDAPTIANIGNQTTNQDTPTSAIAFTVGDVETAAGSLTLTKTSSNTTLIPTTNIIFGGSGANRTVTLTPAAGQTGISTITIIVSDGSLTASDTFVLTVNGVNHAPVANVQSVTTNEDTAKPITLGGSDSDGDSLTYSVVTQPAHGTLSGSAQNLTYTPTANYNGSDSFTFRVNDGTVNSSAATVSITVTPVADAPVANAQSVTTNEDAAKAITLSGSDGDGDSLTYSVVTQPAYGTLSGTAPNLTYAPVANYNGPDSFTFKVNDGVSNSSAATVSITVVAVNDAPVANNMSVTTSEDTMISMALTGSDVEGSTLAIASFTSPAHGTLAGTISNLMYVPDANYSGPDSFTFKLNDGTADSNAATVSITVTPVNDVPVANAQNVAVTKDTDKSIKLTSSDADGDTLTYVIAQDPVHGYLSGTAPRLIYTPDPDYTGTDSFKFKVNDGTVDSAKVVVTITVSAAAAPLTAADPSITSQPAAQSVSVGQKATFSVAASGTGTLAYQWQKNGTSISGATGSSYTTPAVVAADNGAQFSVTVSNNVGSAVSSSATLTIQSSGGSSGGGTVTILSPSSTSGSGSYTTSPTLDSTGGSTLSGDTMGDSFYQGGTIPTTTTSGGPRLPTLASSFGSTGGIAPSSFGTQSTYPGVSGVSGTSSLPLPAGGKSGGPMIASNSLIPSNSSISSSDSSTAEPIAPKQSQGKPYGKVGGALAAAFGLTVLMSESVRNVLGVSDSFSMESIASQTVDMGRRLFS